MIDCGSPLRSVTGIAPTKVIPNWTTAKLPSMFSFMYKAVFDPFLFSRTNAWRRETEIEARAISYAAKTLLTAIMTSMTVSSTPHMKTFRKSIAAPYMLLCTIDTTVTVPRSEAARVLYYRRAFRLRPLGPKRYFCISLRLSAVVDFGSASLHARS